MQVLIIYKPARPCERAIVDTEDLNINPFNKNLGWIFLLVVIRLLTLRFSESPQHWALPPTFNWMNKKRVMNLLTPNSTRDLKPFPQPGIPHRLPYLSNNWLWISTNLPLCLMTTIHWYWQLQLNSGLWMRLEILHRWRVQVRGRYWEWDKNGKLLEKTNRRVAYVVEATKGFRKWSGTSCSSPALRPTLQACEKGRNFMQLGIFLKNTSHAWYGTIKLFIRLLATINIIQISLVMYSFGKN